MKPSEIIAKYRKSGLSIDDKIDIIRRDLDSILDSLDKGKIRIDVL